MTFAVRLLLLSLALLTPACAFFDGGDDDDDDSSDDDDDVGTRGGIGDACTADSSCRRTLRCEGGECQPTESGAMGSRCELTLDCSDGLYCDTSRECTAVGEGAEGADCTGTGDCERGLICSVEGFGGRCRETGEADVGDACEGAADCYAGLFCAGIPGQASSCSADPSSVGGGSVGAPFPIGYWPGEDCGEPDDGAPRAYFSIPRDSAPTDFYRLPFPNDIRRSDDGIDLSGHPHPGTALPIDIIDRYVDMAEQDVDGFSTNPVLFFRFSQPYDWGAVGDSVRIVDVTESSPEYGADRPREWLVTAGNQSKYICPNFIALRSSHGNPLRGGTTYAAIVSRDVEPDDGGSYDRDDDFDAMLDDTAPTDATLREAWEKYAPLRDWLEFSGEDPDDILVASVFTTQNPERVTSHLREVIHEQPLPTLHDVTVCEDGVTSPCDDGESRVCGAESPDYIEIHGRIELPIFQHGEAPYEEPENGGGFELDSNGRPTVARTENVCFGLTIPRGVAPPEGGFPIVIAAHGTGGSFHGSIGQSDLSGTIANDAGTGVRAALLAIDMPQHGERRNGSTRGEDVLFFNFVNPRAARDNVLQGAADLMSLVRFASEFQQSAAGSPTGEEIRFDPTRIVIFAHSQGSMHASLMLPYEPGVSAIVLSGNGGDLTLSLLNKTQPIDIAGVLPFALLDMNGEGKLGLGHFHPALALFQTYFDSVDSVNFARHLYREPLEGSQGANVFMTWGTNDHYSPNPTLNAYAGAGRLPQVGPVVEDIGRDVVDAPLMGNVHIGETDRTIGLRQYEAPSDVDGHFVATRTPEGLADTNRFVLQALAGNVPPIGAP